MTSHNNPYEKVFEVMRTNDMPKAKILFIKEYLCKLKTEGLSKDHVKAMEHNFRLIQKIYSSIDWKKQSKETGEEILLSMKHLLDELTPMFDKILEAAKATDYSPVEVPDRVFEIITGMIEDSEKYGILPAYRQYRSAIANYGGMTRAEWFLQGKPAVENYDLSRIK